MTTRLAGKVAVITGAASGIGAASARMMAMEGARVVIADINREGAEAVARDIGRDQAVAIGTDAGDDDQIQRMIGVALNTFGGIDLLHNNAAALGVLAQDYSVVDADLEIWRESLRVNLLGPVLSSKYAIPHMIRRGGGSIIHTASVAGLQASDGFTAYSATKAALISLSQSIATQYGKERIRSNCIAPGFISTPHAQRSVTQDVIDEYLNQITLPYYGQSDDPAAAVVFLASDESRFITGQVLVVDGGMNCHLPVVSGLRRLLRTL
jgi:NAD(P)-dependent dehydrogenase (short-subunit alcohol dehydrogenase family)